MNTLKKVTLTLFLSAFSLTSLAQIYGETSPKTIAYLGVNETNAVYVHFNEALSINCLYDLIYVPSTNKALSTQLLTARVNNMPITKIYYNQDTSGGLCFATNAEF